MKTDLSTAVGTPVSNFCFGTMQWGGTADAADSLAMYDAARTAGINFFDTAHSYTGGASEKLLGECAASERDALFIATKCASGGNCHPEAITKDFEDSLTRLQMDCVDMLYMHRWSRLKRLMRRWQGWWTQGRSGISASQITRPGRL